MEGCTARDKKVVVSLYLHYYFAFRNNMVHHEARNLTSLSAWVGQVIKSNLKAFGAFDVIGEDKAPRKNSPGFPPTP